MILEIGMKKLTGTINLLKLSSETDKMKNIIIVSIWLSVGISLATGKASYADSHVNEEVAEKLSMTLPDNMGIVPYGEEGTMLYVIEKPPNQARGIFLSMQGSGGCLYGNRGPIQDEEALIANGGPSPRHPSIIIRSASNLAGYGLKVILPNCPDVGGESSDAIYTSAINKILSKENRDNLPVFVGGMSRGSIRATNIASLLGSKIRGAIIMSGSTDNTHDGTMFDPPIKKATSSFLLLIHENDQCSSSESLEGLKSFSEELTGVTAKKIVQLTGGTPSRGSGRGPWCSARSHHGFNGIHDQVLEVMKPWILKRIN